jgi:hypothetical protein
MSKSAEILLGPIVSRGDGFAFDTFSEATGTKPGFAYRCVEQAKYDRNSMLLGLHLANGFVAVACETVDEFHRRCAALPGDHPVQQRFVAPREAGALRV